jgi:hypothetical protein
MTRLRLNRLVPRLLPDGLTARLLLEGLPERFPEVLEFARVHPEFAGRGGGGSGTQTRRNRCLGPQPLSAVDPVGQQKAEHQQGSGQQHREIQAQRLDHPADGGSSDNPAYRRPHLHNGKQPFSFLVRVQVIGETPELSQDHHVEDPDPDEERDPDLESPLPSEKKHAATGGEEDGDQTYEPAAGKPVGHLPVYGDHRNQHERHGRGHVGRKLGPLLTEDETVPEWLQDVVGSEEEEHVHGEDQDVGTFARLHVGEQPQGAVDRAGSASAVHVCLRGQTGSRSVAGYEEEGARSLPRLI